jgi:hypothetical protein
MQENFPPVAQARPGESFFSNFAIKQNLCSA